MFQHLNSNIEMVWWLGFWLLCDWSWVRVSAPPNFLRNFLSFFGKKEVTDPGFEPWSSASERTDLTIALLKVSFENMHPVDYI
jgi:hypothetical protein